MAALRQSPAMGYDEEQTGLLARVVAEVTLSHIAMTADEPRSRPARSAPTSSSPPAPYAIPTCHLEVSESDLTVGARRRRAGVRRGARASEASLARARRRPEAAGAPPTTKARSPRTPKKRRR